MLPGWSRWTCLGFQCGPSPSGLGNVPTDPCSPVDPTQVEDDCDQACCSGVSVAQHISPKITMKIRELLDEVGLDRHTA